MKLQATKPEELELTPELSEVLANFRQGVDAWRDAVQVHPRAVVSVRRGLGWRLVYSSAFGCLLAAAGGTAVVMHHHARQLPGPVAVQQSLPVSTASATQTTVANEQAEAAARDLIAVQRFLASSDSQEEFAEAHVTSDEQLLSAIDTDLKRQVPRAMEPLAALEEAGTPE